MTFMFVFSLTIYAGSRFGGFYMFLGLIVLFGVMYYLFIKYAKYDKIKKYRRDQYLYETQSSGDFYLGEKFNQGQQSGKFVYCPKCGNPNLRSTFFCENCGAELRKE